jgi:membrane peptidoglycan carboxypeptidase
MEAESQEAWLPGRSKTRSLRTISWSCISTTIISGGAYGIEAARSLFRKTRVDLTLSESALLAGCSRARIYAPKLTWNVHRAPTVCSAPGLSGIITAAGGGGEKEPSISWMSAGSRASEATYTPRVRSRRAARRLYYALVISGYRIYTYLDASIQEQAAALMQDDSQFPNRPATNR